MSDDFDWSSKNADVVIQSSGAIAVYANDLGHVVIRQEGQYGDEDPFVTVPVDSVAALLEALIRVRDELNAERRKR